MSMTTSETLIIFNILNKKEFDALLKFLTTLILPQVATRKLGLSVFQKLQLYVCIYIIKLILVFLLIL